MAVASWCCPERSILLDLSPHWHSTQAAASTVSWPHVVQEHAYRNDGSEIPKASHHLIHPLKRRQGRSLSLDQQVSQQRQRCDCILPSCHARCPKRSTGMDSSSPKEARLAYEKTRTNDSGFFWSPLCLPRTWGHTSVPSSGTAGGTPVFQNP